MVGKILGVAGGLVVGGVIGFSIAKYNERVSYVNATGEYMDIINKLILDTDTPDNCIEGLAALKCELYNINDPIGLCNITSVMTYITTREPSELDSDSINALVNVLRND